MMTARSSQLQVHIMRILESFGAMQRDHFLSLRSLLSQRAPGVSLLSVGRYAFHRSIKHRMCSMEVGIRFLPMVVYFLSVGSKYLFCRPRIILLSGDFPGSLEDPVRPQPPRNQRSQTHISTYQKIHRTCPLARYIWSYITQWLSLDWRLVRLGGHIMPLADPGPVLRLVA